MIDFTSLNILLWAGVGAIVGLVLLALTLLISFIIAVPSFVFWTVLAVPTVIGLIVGIFDS